MKAGFQPAASQYDKQVVASLKPGFQPAAFRLQTGKCFVGALARSLSPLNSGTRKMLGKGRLAEVQVLKGQRGIDGTGTGLKENIEERIKGS